ncbi:branched-chain amino acid ABC transporter permease [Aquiluna borgnonia]|uniref:Branched-chain amino acid ABC transporter permease n=1 Tax=Aquiluna borgnonia TaxID=2499157 RepID=A0A7D4UDR6_9MICO|nr:branched-chain amino acid ABC transporter permease [Aquiluna borgnonia]QKJ25914.1 branched-chain amino acid ABC transporter permease [Aquiluna borgnonia]
MSAGTAALADSVGEEYERGITGNVKLDGEPLSGIRITVDGGGYSAETVTGADGKWFIGVPGTEGDAYKITLDQTTLPEGIAVTEGGATQEKVLGKGTTVVQNFFIGEGTRVTVSMFDQVVARLIYGINFGLMLGLAAVGLSLVFGTTGLSNFAHSEMVTFGAIMALVLGTGLQLPIWLAIPAAVLLSGGLGWALDAGLWKPLRKKGLALVQLMIVSIGLSLTVRYLFQYFVGGGTEQLPGADSTLVPLFGSVALSVTDLVSMGISIVVIGGFAWWLLKTKTGKATRAISDNPDLAAASGIDVDKVIQTVWIISGALAGLAGVLWAYFRPGIKWDMGAQILLLIFAAVTLGGLGTAFGALLGSLVVGILVETSSLLIPADLKYVGALVVLIGILLFRPQGILGKKQRIG